VNRDGTGLATVLNTGDAVHQLALDQALQRIYFTRAVSYDGREISHVDTNGANYTVLLAGSGWFPSGLAVDSANNLLYWGDIGVLSGAFNGVVNKMGTDGSAPTQLLPHLNNRGRGYALDPASQTIFLTQHDRFSPGTGGGLFSYDIANNILTQLISDPTTGYWDIEIDPLGQRIWWTDFGRGQIRSARFDGSDVRVELSGLTSPYGLALERPPCFAIDANDDEFSVINDGTTADFSVLANDECSDDPPISVIELPGDLLPDRGGSATTDGATVSYTPAAGFVGFEEFTYTAQDAGLEGGDDPPAVDQDTATVVVDVLENLIPDAVDDLATTLENQATIIDVLENDSLGNAPNVVEIETEPANGSATLQADDTILYSPNFDFFGEDSFEYRLTDANEESDVATVTVGVFFVRGQVPIDIMPNSDGNNLNLRAGQGAGIDIAILSVGEFFEAPNEIDPLTLKFGPREANIWGSPQVRDVDADGDDDLVVKFLIQQTGIPCGDTHAILFGRTFDFQSISGMDTINTFNCPRIRKRH
jgi:DNA-binding beta-propeller fold protein YncE